MMRLVCSTCAEVAGWRNSMRRLGVTGLEGMDLGEYLKPRSLPRKWMEATRWMSAASLAMPRAIFIANLIKEGKIALPGSARSVASESPRPATDRECALRYAMEQLRPPQNPREISEKPKTIGRPS